MENNNEVFESCKLRIFFHISLQRKKVYRQNQLEKNPIIKFQVSMSSASCIRKPLLKVTSGRILIAKLTHVSEMKMRMKKKLKQKFFFKY